MGSNVIVTIIVIVYLLFMLWIGWYSSTKISTNTDFMVAGRRGPLLMAGTLAATEIGGRQLPGRGPERYVRASDSAHPGTQPPWGRLYHPQLRGPKFRAATVKDSSEYFRRRYGKSCGITTAKSSCFFPWWELTAGQFIASAVILSTMLNIDYQVAVIIVAVVVTVYSIMGGLWSVTLTDFVQVFLIVIGMIIAVPFACAGGLGQCGINIPRHIEPVPGL